LWGPENRRRDCWVAVLALGHHTPRREFTQEGEMKRQKAFRSFRWEGLVEIRES